MEETNEERFTRYFCQFNDDLFLYVVRDLEMDRDTAIDLISDVWVVFWEKFHTVKDLQEKQIRKWLWKTAYNKVRNYRRKKCNYSEILCTKEKLEEFQAAEAGVNSDQEEMLEECIRSLRPVEQEVVNTRRSGQSYKDISRKMNKSVAALECIYCRAVKKLKLMIGDKLTSFW